MYKFWIVFIIHKYMISIEIIMKLRENHGDAEQRDRGMNLLSSLMEVINLGNQEIDRIIFIQ